MMINLVFKLSRHRFTIMKILSDGKERCGLEILSESKGQIWYPLLYISLSRLQDEGKVKARKKDEYKGTSLEDRLFYSIATP